jgi:hypothetical protein
MGTRNLTCVVLGGEYKVAQYAQWDGYPDGQGLTILKFLSNKESVERLKNNLSKVRFYDRDGIDKELLEAYNKNAPEWSNEPDNRTTEQIRWWNTYISRDLGGKILKNIANSKDEEILLRGYIDFAGDSLFCEWAYVVDFDKGTFEVYRGFNKEPLGKDERFKDIPMKEDRREFDDGEGTAKYKYYQVKFVKEFKLDDLPTEQEFLDNFIDDEDYLTGWINKKRKFQ